MPTAKLTKEQWTEIRRASEAGITDDNLSETYSVTKAAIRKRRERENWLSIHRVKEIQNQLAKSKEQYEAENGVSHPVITTPRAVELVAETLGDSYDKMAARVVPALADNVIKALESTPHRFIPQNLKELGMAANVVSKLSGKDRPQVAIAISPWGAVNAQEREIIDILPDE